MHKGGSSPQSGARTMVETLTLDPSSLGDGDLTALTLSASGEQLITSDIESLVSMHEDLDQYTTTEVDIGEEGETLCVTVPTSEHIEIDPMEIGETKEEIIPECETELVEYTEDMDMSEIDITTSVIEESPTPVVVESIQGHKIVQVQPQQVSHGTPILVSGSSAGQPSQSFVVIQSAPGGRVISANPTVQGKKGGQIVGRIAGLTVGSSPQFQPMTQTITTARSGAGTVVQLRPISNSSPVQRPLAAKGAMLTVSSLGARPIHPQTSTPSRVTKVLLPRQNQGAGSSVQHLVAIPVQKTGQENQQSCSEQVVTLGHQTLRIVSGNVVPAGASSDHMIKTQKKLLGVGDAGEPITLTSNQLVKPKQETIQVVQAGPTSKPTVQLARAVNQSSGQTSQIVNITVAQAQQMGLLSPGKLQQLAPSVPGRSIVLNKGGASAGGVTVLQSNLVKSPTKILPAPAPSGGATSSNVSIASSSSPAMRPLSLSPSKVIITRQAPIKQGSVLTTSTGQVIRLPASPQSASTSSASVQPMHVAGRTMQYVRLVSIPSSTNTTSTLTAAPRPKATSVLTLSSPGPGGQGQIKMIPIAPAAGPGPRPVLPKSLLARTALSQASGGNAAAQAHITTDRTGVSNIVVLPPTFLQQVRPQSVQIQQQQQKQHQIQQQIQQQQQLQQLQQQKAQQLALQIEQQQQQEDEEAQLKLQELKQEILDDDDDEDLHEDQIELVQEDEFDEEEHLSPQQQQSLLITKPHSMLNAKLMTDAILTPASPLKASGSVRSAPEPNGIRPRKPCNCTKSQCLKMYCDCFANGEFCHMCNCNCCFNNLEHEEDRQRAIKAVLERNPHAFRPKIGKGQVGDGRRHNKGCNCRRSGCLKNYCECYEAKIACSNNCKCVGCRNVEDMNDSTPRALRELARANELRLNPLTALKKRSFTSLQDSGIRPLQDPAVNGFRQSFDFMTQEVVDATCHCLLAQAEKAEKMGISEEVTEKLILEEFGRCLVQIIGCASNRTDDVTT